MGAGPVAGETLKDRTSWPGYGLIVLSLFALASGLTALATGHGGPAAGALTVAVIAMVAGIAWTVVRHRRLSLQISTGTPERPEDLGPVT
ncbi:DUF1129 domain-containing protein [Mycolicibacterium sediminis]|uniref:DUF1129 domain-containing protein n=1 Tax=Mycolicibacterium sediminis TaxID=1286180 RepID=UPI0013D67A3C|nr:DUF1129 domain-containing protein [Mycolicibacterium sediminis]